MKVDSCKSSCLKKFLISFCSVFFAVLLGMVDNVQAIGLELEGIQKGNVTFHPKLIITESYNDNRYLDPSTVSTKTSSWVTEESPSFEAVVELGKHDLTVSYDGTYGQVHSSSTDNYMDHDLKTAIVFDFRRWLGVELKLGRKWGHDEKGANDSVDSTDPNEHTTDNYGFEARIGGDESKGKIEFGASKLDLDYTNNSTNTNGLEYSKLSSNGSLYWEIMPKTSLLTGILYSNYDYVINSVAADSDEAFYFAGLDWSATGKTSGNIKIGYMEKIFDDNSRDDYGGFSWDISVKWEPLSYSNFVLMTIRSPGEPTGVGDHIVRDISSLAWNHEWSDILFTKIQGSYGTANYQGVGQSREDEESVVDLGVGYKINRWGMVNFGYSYSERDSNVNANDYTQNKIMLMFMMAL
ncbi:MAG: outer membrane beta-barrel protein [Magnetococcales bacterium]|nr:outer membrane beta-barrel protein [Magnetococcales bacterium]